jgi:uncharacterized protein (DUF302 family)
MPRHSFFSPPRLQDLFPSILSSCDASSLLLSSDLFQILRNDSVPQKSCQVKSQTPDRQANRRSSWRGQIFINSRRYIMKNFSSLFRATALALLLATVLIVPASAQSFRSTVESHKSFDQTVAQLKLAVSQGGMMVMATVDQGNMLTMTGLKLKATLFMVGNPTVGKKLFEQDHAVGLYVPLRIFVYEDKDGKTFVTYDKPSDLLRQFNNGEISQTAGMLDQKLQSLVQMITQ